MTGIPRQIFIRYEETAEALDKSIMKIEEAVLKALEITLQNYLQISIAQVCI